ncbi:hypothetical protein P12x_006157 (plasmid) [Tundrisphaera lichenicola]|uniref:hypothetical protein n=1 Tax=Tundrisphaera lichenicola TaxID=2029860 RepID=UPI003EB99A08
MTQSQLDRSIADRTGDSLRTVHRIGFGLPAADLEPEDLHLVVDCPFCGHPTPYPGRAGDGSPALAECPGDRCDVYFDFRPGEVYAAGPVDHRIIPTNGSVIDNWLTPARRIHR